MRTLDFEFKSVSGKLTSIEKGNFTCFILSK